MVSGHVNAKLSPICRFGQPGVSDVVLEIKMWIVCPIRVVELEGHVDEKPLEYGRCVKATFNVRNDFLESHVPAGCGRWIVYAEARDMRQVVFGFHIQESRILRL